MATVTLEQLGEITKKNTVLWLRAKSRRLEERAARVAPGKKWPNLSKEQMLADAAIAAWEADTIERDGHLPEEYVALLRPDPEEYVALFRPDVRD